MTDTWASPYLAAQAEYFRHLGAAAAAESIERDGIYAVRTGIASNTENGVVAGNAQFERALAADVIAWVAERKLPASWICAEGAHRAETAQMLEALGCRPDRGAWEMRGSLDQVTFDYEPPNGVDVRRAGSERELDAWLDVAGTSGWYENGAERRAWRKVLLDLGLPPAAPIRLLVAFRGERAVAMASAFYTGTIALLTAVAVLPDERRRGIGRALASLRLREARERGCRTAVLAPSPDGSKLYTALAFETHQQPGDRWFYLPAGTG